MRRATAEAARAAPLSGGSLLRMRLSGCVTVAMLNWTANA
jgi:hypothetical protein